MSPISSSDETKSPKLEDVLESCQSYAEIGRALATDSISLLKQSISSSISTLDYHIQLLNRSNIDNDEFKKSLQNQLNNIRSNFQCLPEVLTNNLNSLSKSGFSITLFGRTMAGKSTLMEILVHGSGASIGHGAQRTTLDVRTYSYKGLEVTDVPGIAAYEGTDDERIAFAAAQKSDLILFLINDNNPQECEAECLKNIVAMGKPVIFLMNVMIGVDPSMPIKLMERDFNKCFNFDRLNTIRKQFIGFGHNFGQSWDNIPFAYVHLKSAFLSQHTDDPVLKTTLWRMSHFDYFESLLISTVRARGCFYKIKSFTDIVIAPLTQAAKTLFEQSGENLYSSTVVSQKIETFQTQANSFQEQGNRRIDSFVRTLQSDLKQEITSFAEIHYNDSMAADRWNQFLRNYKIEDKAAQVMQDLQGDCHAILKETLRTLRFDLDLSNLAFKNCTFTADGFIDGKRIWDWCRTLLGSGLMIAAFWWHPAGWLAIGVGVLGWLGSHLFKSREERIRDARRKLESQLNDHLDSQLKTLSKNMHSNFDQKIIQDMLCHTASQLDSMEDSFITLSDAQCQLAIQINNKLSEMNRAVILSALDYLGRSDLHSVIHGIARIPGYAVMLVLEEGTVFPNDVCFALGDILQEKIWYIIQNHDPRSLLVQAIWPKKERRAEYYDQIQLISISEELTIARIPFTATADEYSKSRIQMAQQLTNFLIIK